MVPAMALTLQPAHTSMGGHALSQQTWLCITHWLCDLAHVSSHLSALVSTSVKESHNISTN